MMNNVPNPISQPPVKDWKSHSQLKEDLSPGSVSVRTDSVFKRLFSGFWQAVQTFFSDICHVRNPFKFRTEEESAVPLAGAVSMVKSQEKPIEFTNFQRIVVNDTLIPRLALLGIPVTGISLIDPTSKKPLTTGNIERQSFFNQVGDYLLQTGRKLEAPRIDANKMSQDERFLLKAIREHLYTMP